jgi:hypothetical protein
MNGTVLDKLFFNLVKYFLRVGIWLDCDRNNLKWNGASFEGAGNDYFLTVANRCSAISLSWP